MAANHETFPVVAMCLCNPDRGRDKQEAGSMASRLSATTSEAIGRIDYLSHAIFRSKTRLRRSVAIDRILGLY